ncbi:hypothetical protein Ngar_c16360 [Candidatus Nitrososphaera gargensis Ga9.2]|uniref:Uncharacterized protein n=1 Tax=Nitrososphaera gargensis (strain Ga9.2) TaxID=1237085 RepID=K0IN12_NITGG|nr:hypothetical protein Ngar_c16360 [Candidatus Nitrososphaera gargensis Ga9.2]
MAICTLALQKCGATLCKTVPHLQKGTCHCPGHPVGFLLVGVAGASNYWLCAGKLGNILMFLKANSALVDATDGLLLLDGSVL